ncbi:UNVERIFIED_CONTAM: hypothetical protein PYX00_011024 [Menopon gallinae]|uniref:Uncharacterized protein n=1 Tax=Menopon gallinae TaxID=328185 RepID=A0AAW2H6L0_9NEOP
MMPFSLKRPKLGHSAAPTEEGGGRRGAEDGAHAIGEILRDMPGCSDTKRALHLLEAVLASTYLSSRDIVGLCDLSFDLLRSDTESLLRVYFLLLERVDKTELPVSFPSVLGLVETHLLGNTSLHHVFRVFRKVHPPRVMNLLELVLKKVCEADIGIKLVALDILLKENSTPAFFEDLVSLYDHVDARKTEGMEFRHLAIVRCFSSCVVQCRESGGGTERCVATGVFSEDNYIRCANAVFASQESSCLRGVTASCLKRLRTCGSSRTFVIAFIVFHINRLRSTKKCPSAFLLSVFGKFLGLTHSLGERIFETVSEETVYRGVLKLSNTGESLAYVARAIFMFLLRLLKRSRASRRGLGRQRMAGVADAECRGEDAQEVERAKAGPCRSSAETFKKAAHTVGRIIRTLLKADAEYIGLSTREKVAAVEILKSHFHHQSPSVKELIVAFLDALGYQSTFGLLRSIANDTSTAVRRRVFERLLRFAGDPDKLPDVVGVYFSLLRDGCHCDVSFGTQALARPFYLEEEKEIARHFRLSDTSMDTLERAVLVKHYVKYKPEEASLDAAVCVLDDTEMVKVKKNSEYVNTILKIAASLLARASKGATACAVGRSLRKRLEAFCTQFVFYDVYVAQCARVLRLLGYTSLGGAGDYYTLINACLGNRTEARTNTVHGRKALVAYLDHHPEEILVYRRHVVDLFQDAEVLPDLLKLLLTHIRSRETEDGPKCAPLEVQRSSTTAELYFNFVSTCQECIFEVANTDQPAHVLVLVYRLLSRATHIGAVLSQLSVPRMLRIIHRCRSLSPDRAVMLYTRDIINTLQDTLGFVLGTEAGPREGHGQQQGPELCPVERERRCMLGEIYTSIRSERDRLLLVEKLVSLANPGNVFHISKALVRLDMSAKEARALDTCIRETMQSMLVTESGDSENLHCIAIAYALSLHRRMLRTRRCAAGLEEAERLAEASEYAAHERRFILELGSPAQFFM